jgi:hypothetical protein
MALSASDTRGLLRHEGAAVSFSDSLDAERFRGVGVHDVEALQLDDDTAMRATELVALGRTTFDETALLGSGDTDELTRFLEHFESCVVRSDQLVASMGSYRAAHLAMRHVHSKAEGHSVDPRRIGELEKLLDPHLLRYLRHTSDVGVEMRTAHPAETTLREVGPHKSASDNTLEVLLSAYKLFVKCGTLLLSDDSRPFMADVRCSPVARVCKRDPATGQLEVAGRIVHNHAFNADGKPSTNDITGKAHHTPTVCPLHEEVVLYLVFLCFMWPGVGVVGTKRDVSSAFHQVGVAASDANYFATMLPSRWSQWSWVFVIYFVLSFGWSASPGEYGAYGHGIEQAHRRTGPSEEDEIAAPQWPFGSFTFVDDGIVFEPNLATRIVASARWYEHVMRRLFNGAAINESKKRAEGSAVTSLMLWGLWLDMSRAHLGAEFITLGLPEHKILKGLAMMTDRQEMRVGARRVSTKSHEQLTGHAQSWSVASWEIRSALPSLYLMSGFKGRVWITPTGSELEKQLAWEEYDEAKRFIRLVLTTAAADPAHFSRPIPAVLDPFVCCQVQGGREKAYINSDANGFEDGANGIVSTIDFHTKTWSVFRGSDVVVPLEAQFRGAPKAWIIFVLELIAVIAMACERGAAWRGLIIVAVIDNDNAKCVLNSRSSRNVYVRYLLRLLARVEVMHDFRVIAVYINTKTNVLADDLGRFEGAVTGRKAGWLAHAQMIVDSFEPGLRFVDLGKLTEWLTQGQTVLRTYALPDDDPESVAARTAWASVFGSSAPGAFTVPTVRATPPPPGSVVEMAAGIGVYSTAFGALGVPLVASVEPNARSRVFLSGRFPTASHLSGWPSGAWPPSVTCEPVHFVVARGPGPGGRSMAVVDLVRAVSSAQREPVLFCDVDLAIGERDTDAGLRLQLLDEGLQGVGMLRTPRLAEGLFGTEVIRADDLGAPLTAARLALHYEHLSVLDTLGACPPVAFLGDPPGTARSCAVPITELDTSTFLGGDLQLLVDPQQRPGRATIVAFIELGGANPLFLGSLVELAVPGVRYRIVSLDGTAHAEVVPYGCSPATSSKQRVAITAVSRHCRQRRPVGGLDHAWGAVATAGTLPEGPGKLLLLDTRVGPKCVRPLSSREIWRLLGISEEDFNDYCAANRFASEADLARAGGGMPSRLHVEASVRRTVERAQLFQSAKGRSGPGERWPAQSALGRVFRGWLECRRGAYAGGEEEQPASGAAGRQKQRPLSLYTSGGDVRLAAAKFTLLSGCVSTNSMTTYRSAFLTWVLWRIVRGEDIYLSNEMPLDAKQEALLDFYAFHAVEIGYAPTTMHTTLYAIRFFHMIAEHDLDLRTMVRLGAAKKGHKRIHGGPTRKLAVTVDLILDVYHNGGLDLEKWDDLMLMLAVTMAFTFLWRSCEYVAKSGAVDEDKVLKVKHVLGVISGGETPAPTGELADELLVFHPGSKGDQRGHGDVNNIYADGNGSPLCPVALFNKARAMRPHHFANGENYLFKLLDGGVLDKAAVEWALRSAAMRTGIPVDAISSHSLRAGGATAMWHAGFSAHEIQRRGRWRSDCFKRYIWEGRERARNVATRMLEASASLFGAMKSRANLIDRQARQ